LRTLFILFFLLRGYIVFSQELISIGGGFSQNNLVSISYSVGELAIETLSSGNKIITQGFQQPIMIVSGIKEIPELDYEISVFPNPTQDKVILKVSTDLLTNKYFSIYDMNGKLILRKKIDSNQSEISFSNFLQSMYLLKIFDGRQELKVFRIIKY